MLNSVQNSQHVCFCIDLRILILAVFLFFCIAHNVSADHPASTCPPEGMKTVNSPSDNNCITVTALHSAQPIEINGYISGSEKWEDAPLKDLSGSISGKIRFMRSVENLFFLISVNDNDDNLNNGDRIELYFDPLHNHNNIVDDKQVIMNRNNQNNSGVQTGNLSIVDAKGTAATGTACTSPCVIPDFPSGWSAEVRLTGQDLGVSDLSMIMGFKVVIVNGDTSSKISWPDPEPPSPATWANLKTRYPIQYMIVLDQSGSMLGQSKWDNAKQAVNFLANTMAIFRDAAYFDDKLGVTTFSWDYGANVDETTVPKSLLTVPAFPVGNYADSIPPPLNCTPIGKGIDMAFAPSNLDASVPTVTKERERVVLLLSDGLHNSDDSHNCGSPDMPILLPSLLSYDPCPGTPGWDQCTDGTNNVQINTVAFGKDWGVDTALLQNITNRFEGQMFEGTYTITTNPEELKLFFIESLGELYQMNLISDPANLTPTEFQMNSNEKRLVVIESWSNAADATLIRLQRKDTAASPWNDVDCSYPTQSDTAVGYGICIVDNPDVGIWRARDNAGNPVTSNSQFALIDLNLRARFAIDRQVHGTGRDIILTADLKEAGVPVTNDPTNHQVKVTVNIKRPGEGFGSYVSTRTLDRCEAQPPALPPIEQDVDLMKDPGRPTIPTPIPIPSPSMQDPKPARFMKIDTLFKLCEKEELVFVEEPGIELHDDGTHGDVTPDDGIYTLRFDNTQYEGSYVFRFKATGISPSGSAFSRGKNVAEYLRVEVDPGETDFDWREYQRKDNIVVGQFYAIPRDRFGGYWGPGYPEQIRFKTSAGSFITSVVDHNNGIYSQMLRYDESKEHPVVSAIGQGKDLGSVKTLKTHELVFPFVGWFSFDDKLNIDDGLVLGARFGYRLTSRLAAELEGGITFTESKAGDSGNVLQALANLRYDVYSINTQIGQLTPFVTAGAGYVFFRGLGNDDEAFALQGGIGATLILNNLLGIRVDGRVFHFNDVMDAEATTNYQATGSLVFWF